MNYSQLIQFKRLEERAFIFLNGPAHVGFFRPLLRPEPGQPGPTCRAGRSGRRRPWPAPWGSPPALAIAVCTATSTCACWRAG